MEHLELSTPLNLLPTAFNGEELYENNNNGSTQEVRCVDDEVSTPSIYQTAIFFVLALITLISNLLLIVVVLKTKNLRKKTNYILISMAGADLLVGLISEPIWALALWIDDENKVYITTAKFVVHFSLMSSVCHLLVVTVERTIAVLKPLHYRAWVTCSRVQLVIGATWMWSFFVGVLHPFLWTAYSYYLFIVWTGLAVLVVIAVLHCTMLCALRRATMALRNFDSHSIWYENTQISESAAVKNARLREKRKTKLVAIITLVFAVCTIPSVISETMCYFDKITQGVKNTINLLFFLNSFINPIIFAFREPRFQSALKRMCGCHNSDNVSQYGSRSNLRIDHSSRSDTSSNLNACVDRNVLHT